jgi:hypothetical protein
MVNLSNSENTLNDDNNEQDYNSDDLPTLRRTLLLKQPCNLITNRMLKEKRARDNTLPLEQLIQKNIFNT